LLLGQDGLGQHAGGLATLEPAFLAAAPVVDRQNAVPALLADVRRLLVFLSTGLKKKLSLE
jgi:hypothetical protein